MFLPLVAFDMVIKPGHVIVHQYIICLPDEAYMCCCSYLTAQAFFFFLDILKLNKIMREKTTLLYFLEFLLYLHEGVVLKKL